MLALLLKPGVETKRRYSASIKALVDLGAVILESGDAESLRLELSALRKIYPELTLVACGGDGTVHLAMNAAYDLNIDFAVIPMGTGNDFARYIGIGNSSLGLLALNEGVRQTMDLGVIKFATGEVQYFAGIASCGFDAEVNERANGYRGPAGTAKYLFAVFRQLGAMQAQRMQLGIDEVELDDHFTLVAIANTSSYGGGMKVCPTANAYDGDFEITIVGKVSRSLLVRVLPRVFWGGHVKHPKVSQAIGKRVSIAGDAPLIYADGERIGRGPATFEILPGAIRVWQATPR